MNDYIEIFNEAVLKESQTTKPGFCDTKYIIYLNPASPGQKIRVNTYYRSTGDKISLCQYYDRGLCDTMDEYWHLTLDYIENQAYGAWMDGAR